MQFSLREHQGTGREGTTLEQAENSWATGEKQAISIITNYNVQRTDLGTVSANLSGQPPGSMDSLDREILEEREGGEEAGRERMR